LNPILHTLLLGLNQSLAALLLAATFTAQPAKADTALWSALRSGGNVLLMRHAATNPGVGDPPQFRLDDCGTQRNLSTTGQAQAERVGKLFAKHNVVINTVLSSRWCRCLDTARLAFGKVTPYPALDSFFGERSDQADAQTSAARARIQAFSGPGNLMMVTHQVNITALTGQYPAEGEIFVVRADAHGALQWIGRIATLNP
jgi:broad specificity phosphatase PhoE